MDWTVIEQTAGSLFICFGVENVLLISKETEIDVQLGDFLTKTKFYVFDELAGNVILGNSILV